MFKNKGSRLVPKNFRPVSLVLMLSKLYDFVLLARFKKWFTPNDMQTAYQHGKSCSDHIFFLRCLIQHFNRDKRTLFITAIDFDGAFDRVKRSTLLKKLVFFGASSVFVSCLANLYSVSRNTIYNNGESVTYMLYAGIKQGLPLSPFLFLFYVDDIFKYLERAYIHFNYDVFDGLHILVHADDANLIAKSRELMIEKLKTLLVYCKTNSIILQPTKCYFTVINGDESDKSPLKISETAVVEFKNYLEILGSHISMNIKLDIELHFKKRFKNVIKYFNFVRSNKIAPVSVKLKVMKSCVMSTLLYNCETFGPYIPEGLEALYYKMLKVALGVRPNCPNMIVMIESGCLPLECIIRSRQWKFFHRFRNSLEVNSRREAIFKELLLKHTKYLKHYVDLVTNYTSCDSLSENYLSAIKRKINVFGANKDNHYKFWIYLKMNPELTPSPFLNRIDKIGKAMIKFRLGSHKLSIELGRWNRIPREDRLCLTCNKLGDEFHVVYECHDILRGDLMVIPDSFSSLWTYADVNILFKRIVEGGYLE